MPYTVVWAPAAEAKLAEAWVANPHQRAAITEAAFRIDYTLRFYDEFIRTPAQALLKRVIRSLPLAALYEISEEDRLITVCLLFHRS